MQKQKKQNNVFVATVKGTVRGAAKGGGTIGAPFRAAQAGINGVKSVHSGIKRYNESQRTASIKKPVKSAKPKLKK